MKNPFSYLLVFVLAGLCLGSCADRYISIQGYAQGGLYNVKLNVEGVSVKPEKIKADIDSILNEIDMSLSGYNSSSYLTRWNAGHREVTNALFDDIFEISRDFYDKTGGALNVAAGPLFDIWGFGFTSDSLPDTGTIEAAISRCNINDPEQLNFNAIAQGYSCDLVADYLHSIGVHDMLVDIGEIFCEGKNPNGYNWTLGIDSPVDGNNIPGNDIKAILTASGSGPQGIVTSGNYRKFYIRDGKKYSHTIDPRTGYPVSHNLLSATIIAPTATEADAYATYCMVLGLEESQSFILASDELEACLIYDDNGEMKVWQSPGARVTLPQ